VTKRPDPDPASSTARTIRDFLASHDAIDPTDREAVFRIRARAYGEQYRRERKIYAAWIDFGGEG
jgi:hypothetical protein